MLLDNFTKDPRLPNETGANTCPWNGVIQALLPFEVLQEYFRTLHITHEMMRDNSVLCELKRLFTQGKLRENLVRLRVSVANLLKKPDLKNGEIMDAVEIFNLFWKQQTSKRSNMV